MPNGFVVKNGSNARDSVAGSIPVPVSVTPMLTNSPVTGWSPNRAPAGNVWFATPMVRVPPLGMASRALSARFTSALSS